MVFLFEHPGDTLTTMKIESVVEALTIGIYTQGNDVQVMAVDVLVFEYHVRLTAITHFFHILTGDVFHLGVRESVVGMRIERNV